MVKLQRVSVQHPIFNLKTYDLLDVETGESVPYYSDFMDKVIQDQIQARRESQNTIDALANDLHVFLSYVYNAQDVFFKKGLTTTASLLADIILSYPDYLTLGCNSKKIIAKETALATGSNPVSKSTANRYLASVNGFVEASASIHDHLKKAVEFDLFDIDISSDNIHANLLKRRELTPFERDAMLRRSVLSQVMSGGPKYVKTKLFKVSSHAHSKLNLEFKSFPVSHIVELLDVASTYRDRALWSLMLGAGLRTSEACQLLVKDVDIVQEKIKVFSYRDRVDCFEGLSVEDSLHLSFKGRETEDAFFIEPFGEIFFDSVTKYLKYERPKGLLHRYLFVTNSNRSRGRPLFASSRASRLNAIHKAQKAINCPKKDMNGRPFGLHSLRHFYGYWLKNFHKTSDGLGFTDEEIQHFMGHASINSTRKYAVTDKVIASEKMRLANLVLQNKSNLKDGNPLVEQQNHVLENLLKGSY